jgi:hypothetical protein
MRPPPLPLRPRREWWSGAWVRCQRVSGEIGGRVSAASVWHFLIGPPLRARDVSREQITPLEGLPALSLDALTSVAYGPEAIILVLAAAGAAALHLVLPITIAIVALLGFTLSQTGLLVHWRRTRPRRWQDRAIITAPAPSSQAWPR